VAITLNRASYGLSGRRSRKVIYLGFSCQRAYASPQKLTMQFATSISSAERAPDNRAQPQPAERRSARTGVPHLSGDGCSRRRGTGGVHGSQPRVSQGRPSLRTHDQLHLHAGGNAIGFRRGRYIYDMRGRAIGQLNDSHVHKLSGQYVGELHDDMVVDKHLGNLGNIVVLGTREILGALEIQGNRGARGTSYRDVFAKLTE
jgi:hypothetical protein